MGEHLEYIQKQTHQHKIHHLQDKQLQKVEEVPNNSEKAFVKKLYDRSARIQ